MMKSLKTMFALAFAVLGIACSDQSDFDRSACANGQCAAGGQPPEACPPAGQVCYSEGSNCGGPSGVTCHCGYWVPSGSDQCKQACPSNQQPPSTCIPGLACATSGTTCSGNYGSLECYCGFWATPGMKAQYTCGSQNPGTGGSGGSGGSNPGTGGTGNTGNTGGYGPSTETYEVRVEVYAPGADHIWCEDAMTSAGSDGANAIFYEDWGTMMSTANTACDTWDGAKFSCTRRVSKGLALQFQCYMESGVPQPGDNVRYTCAYPTQLYGGESFAVYVNGQLVNSVPMVDNPAPDNGFYNCKVQL